MNILNLFKIKKKNWGKWQDVTIITSKGYWYLLQVREDLDTNEKQYKQRPIGWVNDMSNLKEIESKTNIIEKVCN